MVYVLQHSFSSSSKDLCKSRRAGQERWENKNSGETAQHPFQDFKGESVSSLFLQVLHIPISEGGFLQLFVCWFFSCAYRIQPGCPCLAWVERKLSSGAGNPLVFLKGLSSSSEAPSPLGDGRWFSTSLQETVSCLLLPLLAVIQVSLFSWNDWSAGQTEILVFFFPCSFSKGNKWKEKVILQLKSSRPSFGLCILNLESIFGLLSYSGLLRWD